MSHAHAVGLLIPFLFSFSVVYILAATFYVDMFQKARDKASHKGFFFFFFFSFNVGERAWDEELIKQ